jgi:dynein heavy chain
MTLFSRLPTVLMKPVEKLSRGANKIKHYNSPVYVYPIRYGTRERPSYLFTIKLPMSPEYDEAFFIKRGAACLLSLAD